MNLSPEQEACCDWFRGPMLCLGTPGAGKTTVIVNRVRRLMEKYHIPENKILVITFTRAAAKEMEERFLSLMGKPRTGVRFSTFHSFFYWVLRTASEEKSLGVLPQGEAYGIMRPILEKLLGNETDLAELTESVLRQLDRISADRIDIENYYSTDIGEREFRQAARAFQQEKRRRGLLDFNDMSEETLHLLTRHPEIRRRLQELYPFILVDEYQDTNRIQYDILKLLLGPEKNLFAVGDDDQSVYGFRGGRPEIMLSFQKEFPEGRIMALSRNFRCPRRVTALSAGLICHNKKRYAKDLRAASGEAGRVRLFQVRDRKAETDQLIREIQEGAARGIPYEEMAILTRTNRGGEGLVFQLENHNIPFILKDRPITLFNNMAVKPVVAYLAWLAGDRSRENFLLFMNRPVRYIPRRMLLSETVDLESLLEAAADIPYLAENIRELIRDLRTAGSLSPYSAISYYRTVMGYDDDLQKLARERNLYYDEMEDGLEDLSAFAADCKTFPGFFEKRERMTSILQAHKEETGGVQLMTLHGAKGLEFTAVHIPDFYEGSIPYKRAKTDGEIEEERRLLYVGMTRAKRELSLYAPDYEREKPAKPSRFLQELEEQNGKEPIIGGGPAGD